MKDPRDHLADWLRDAHAMEKAAIDILDRQESRIENYPELRAKVREHRDVTRRQAERLEECIQRLGGDTSALKDLAGRFMGNMSAFMNVAASDEVVKNGIADYAFEHFEIASYRSLIAAAEEIGEDYVASVCREILSEEEEMAGWLEQNLPIVTQRFLERELADEEAKR